MRFLLITMHSNTAMHRINAFSIHVNSNAFRISCEFSTCVIIAIKLQMPFRLENRDHLRQASEWATLATYLPEGEYTISLFLTVCQSGIL
jgi:hypothetical protein